MLTTYVPAAGPQAGVSYTLPWTTSPPIPALHYASAYTPVARANGAVVQSGTGMLYTPSGDISCEFTFSGNWAKNIGGYADTTAASIRTAMYDFAQYVLAGGGGTLTAVPPTGMKKGKGSLTTITSAHAVAYASADSEPELMNGGTLCHWRVTFLIPTAEWILSDSSTIPLFAIF